VREGGTTLHGTFLRIGLFKPQDEDGAEVLGLEKFATQGAVIVSRRIGSAVIRNKVKRRLREIYRHELPRLKPGLWIVVTAKPAAATTTLSTLRAEWLRLASRLSIFADS